MTTAPTPPELRADIERRHLTRAQYAALVPISIHHLRRWLYKKRKDQPVTQHPITAARLAALVAEPIDKESQE